MRVHGDLVLCGVTDETLVIGEGDIGGRGSVSLVVGNDFYTVVLPDTDASAQDQSAKGRETRKEMKHTSRWCPDQCR